MSEANTENKQTENKSSSEDLLKALDAKIESFKQAVDSKLDGIKASSAPVKQEPAEEDDLSSLLFSDTNKAVEKITKKVEDTLERKLNSQSAVTQEFNDTYVKLAQDYPEIASPNSKMHQRARELVGELSKGRQNDAGALERAVFRAANELGVVAMKYRKQEEEGNDDGSYSGAGSAPTGSKRSRKEEDSLDPRTLAFAQMIGKDVTDPEYVKRLKQINKTRKGNWGRYS